MLEGLEVLGSTREVGGEDGGWGWGVNILLWGAWEEGGGG